METMRAAEPVLAARHPEDRDLRPAERGTARLGQAIDQLAAIASHLEDRLGWVLDPNEMLEAARAETPEPTRSILAGMLHARASEIEEIVSRFERIISRLDLPA